MKLVVIYEKPILGNKRLYPRDIRNYIGAITKEDEPLNKIAMWHKNMQPPLIYSMPNRKSFAIYSFLPKNKIEKDLEAIKKCILKNKEIHIKGINLKVKEVFIADYEYTEFQNGYFERNLMTPMIIASSNQEYRRARMLSQNNEINHSELEKMMTDTIKESIRFQHKDWFNQDDVEIEDLMLIYKDVKYMAFEYKKDQWYPAVRATIISNKMLPHFLGYKSGLGFGELASMKIMDNRKKYAKS